MKRSVQGRGFAGAALAALCVAAGGVGCGRTVDPHAAWREVVTQVATLPALQQGYGGSAMAVSNLLARGDHGWGAMAGGADAFVVHTGVVCRIAADGSVDRPAADAAVAFAQLTWFAPDAMLDVMDVDPRLFGNMMRWKQPDVGWIKAVRITGRFKDLALRLPPLASVRGGEEIIRTIPQADGVLLGFQMLGVAGAIAPPGFHFTYLSRDGTTGGAVRDFTLQMGRIEIDDTPVLSVLLPRLAP